jgi:hypothetical protein
MAIINFNKVSSIIEGLTNLLTIPKPPVPEVPKPLILLAGNRPGLCAQEMAAEIIKRSGEAGLPFGVLPNGQVNPREKLEQIRCQVIIDYLATKARFSIAIEPGQTVVAYGEDASGAPVTVAGTTTSEGIGYGIIQ